MKCVRCGTDNNLKDRTGNNGRCIRCDHPFAFEPTTMAANTKFTDPFFDKAIKDISVQNTLNFTPKQFLYFLDKRLKYKKINLAGFGCLWLFFTIWVTLFFGGILSSISGGKSFIVAPIILNLGFLLWIFNQTCSQQLTYEGRQKASQFFLFLVVVILGGGITISFKINSFPLLVITIIIGILGSYWGIRQLLNKKPSPQSFLMSLDQVRDWIERWQTINGTVEKLLPPSSVADEPVSINPEILNYSFDRVIVCQSSEIAQFLIANNFPFEHNCAVLSITRYPENIFDTVLQMLKQNPELKVYALHNANPRGVSLIHHLRSSENWFANTTATIYDLGLSPRQVLGNPKLFLQQSDSLARDAKQLPPEVKQNLLPEEIAWLEAGYFIELESFSPQHLLRIVTRGITTNRQEDSLTVLDEEERGITSVYMFENFG